MCVLREVLLMCGCVIVICCFADLCSPHGPLKEFTQGGTRSFWLCLNLLALEILKFQDIWNFGQSKVTPVLSFETR